MRELLLAVALAALAGCVSEAAGPTGQAAATTASGSGGSVRPRYATYRCGADGQITVENFRTSVLVVDSDGETVELPASPPGADNRFGEPPYALVLENDEALWMKNGRAPITCRR